LGFQINLYGKGQSMNRATEQFAEINKAGYNNAVRLATLSLEKAEHLASFNFQAAKAALAQGVHSAGVVGGIKDPKEFAVVNTKLSEAGVQHAVGYTRGLYEIASQGQAEFSALANEAWAGYTKGVTAWVETAAKNAPAGSEIAVKAIKSTVAATNAAYEQFSKASRQVVSLTDATVRAAIAKAAKPAPATKRSKAS
jgi:phasin family protein